MPPPASGPGCRTGRGGQPHHAVPADVLVVGGRLGLLALLGEQRLVHRPVGDDPDRFEKPELVVEAHHRLRHLFQDVVGGLAHVVGHDHRRGERGQRYGCLTLAAVADREQIQVAEHAVEEFGFRLRVPVQGVEVDRAVLADEIGEVVEDGCGGVGVHCLQAVEPDREDVLRGATGQQPQVLARADGPLGIVSGVVPLRVVDVEEPGVDREPPRLTGLRGTVLVRREPEVFGRGGQLRLDELPAGADPGLGSRPAGEPDGPGEQRRGERVPCQLRLGVQPYRWQDGALCGHQVVLLGRTGVRARTDPQGAVVPGRPSVDAFRPCHSVPRTDGYRSPDGPRQLPCTAGESTRSDTPSSASRAPPEAVPPLPHRPPEPPPVRRLPRACTRGPRSSPPMRPPAD